MSVDLSGALGGSIAETLEGEVSGFIKQLGGQPKLLTLNVNENGTYTPPEGYDGYNEVTVDVEPTLDTLSVTENGNVPTPTLTSLTVTNNGTYTAPENTGYNEVIVNTPVTNNFNVLALRKGITDSGGSGTYNINDYYYGMNLNNKTLFTDMLYMYANGSNYYKCTYNRTINDSSTWSDSWGYLSGNSYVVANVYCALTSDIHVISDYQTFTGNENYVFDIPTEAQSLDLSHFFVDFDWVESGGFSMSSAISKSIVNNQLIINFNFPTTSRGVHARIIYVI